MICKTLWSHERYLPPLHQKNEIYICRIVPSEHSIRLDFKGDGCDHYTVFYRAKEEPARSWESVTVQNETVLLADLTSQRDYEFFIRSEANESTVGIARTGSAPGTVVNYLHPKDPKYAFSGQHLCSPSLLKHPDGYLLASMDVFGRQTPQNLTLIFRSDDQGATWYHYSELFPCFWGKLFLHRGEVYMLATSTEYGDLLVGRSTDGGKNWQAPTVLLRGSCNPRSNGWHKSAMPVIQHRGRLWTGIDYGAWITGGHASALLSIDAEADLLTAENWHLTELLPYNDAWEGSVIGDNRGFLEGNAVVLPDGEIGEMLRYTTDKGTPSHGLIPILRGDSSLPEKQLKFEKYVSFPGNLSKFDILFDEVSGRYYSIVDRIHDPANPGVRNLLSLVCSPDLESWEVVTNLLDLRAEDPKTTGLQYVSFLFDGDDILYLCRTAVNGAENFHNNNYITFHRIPNFRNLHERD